jgi:predicted RNase H-like nuclease (RuvC/YqgF family)
MKIICYSLYIVLILALCTSCNKEVKNLQEEIKSLRNENNFFKAENVALKKEVEELYKKINEQELVKQKAPASKDKEEKIVEKDLEKQKQVLKPKEDHFKKENTSKKPGRVEPDRIKKPENGKTGR